jgi:hypothetical protein
MGISLVEIRFGIGLHLDLIIHQLGFWLPLHRKLLSGPSV